jgi:hypothetical protein
MKNFLVRYSYNTCCCCRRDFAMVFCVSDFSPGVLKPGILDHFIFQKSQGYFTLNPKISVSYNCVDFVKSQFKWR